MATPLLYTRFPFGAGLLTKAHVAEQHHQSIFYKAEGWVSYGVTVMGQKSSRRKEPSPKRWRNISIFSGYP
ncbi:hypothetical protein SAMN05421852_1283 [Thermoflavimicrobium dichotomicum]|uniref:Uncharacterized protein n=1 Tax=Thermoflavimicrobium dichotomicum TaxID=46223 RepID=A0A1I3UW29_9BACL|nr:hypothetical protein SAMN05421852_1283 [Thermoflavimicrobium dichotomicum]